MSSINKAQQDKEHGGSDGDELITMKKALKEEARQTLLKQCYKMAMNKYLRLIAMGAEGFNAREWSVIHLNTAICYQFQNRMPEALEKVNEAIRIDPTYEKSYYRRLQILDDMGEHDMVFHPNIIPSFIKNSELEKLKQEILEKFRKTVGFRKLESKLKSEEFLNKLGSALNVNKFVDDTYRSIFSRIMDVGTTEACQDSLEISKQIASHYRFLKQEATQNSANSLNYWLSSFCSSLHKIWVKNILDSSQAEVITVFMLLAPFWKEYSNLYTSFLGQQEILGNLGFSCGSTKENENGTGSQFRDGIGCEANLLVFYPATILDSTFFINLISCLSSVSLTESEALVKNSIKFVHTNTVILQSMPNPKSQPRLSDNEGDRLHQALNQIIGKHLLKSYSFNDLRAELQLLTDKIIRLEHLLVPSPTNKLKETQPFFTFAYRAKQAIQIYKSIDISKLALRSICKQLAARNGQKRPSFASFYLSYQVITTIPAKQLRQIKQGEELGELEDQLSEIVTDLLPNLNDPEQVALYLIAVSILGDLNPLSVIKMMQRARSSDNKSDINCKVTSLLQEVCRVQRMRGLFLQGVCRNIESIMDIYASLLTLLAISDLKLLSLILDSPSSLTALYVTLENLSVEGKTHRTLRNSIKLLYALVVDVKQQQQKDYAQQLGVSEEEVHKARQLQGQAKDSQLVRQISQKRDKLIAYLVRQNGEQKSSDWSRILKYMVIKCREESAMESENCVQTWMMASIVLQLAEKQPALFYLPEFVNFMLGSFKTPPHASNKMDFKIAYSIGRYFSIICKNSNSNLFSYTQLQPIVDCLIFLIQQGHHELHIFQAILSLINLSSKTIRVPLEIVEICLMEQNEYIAHGAFELLNNLIVNGDFTSKNDGAKLRKLEQMTKKYYDYYQTVLKTEMESGNVDQKVAITNYSHPYKIFSTLLSLLQLFYAVADTNQDFKTLLNRKIAQLDDWKSAHRVLKHMHDHGSNISITLFKLVLHHGENRTLPTGWSKGLQKSIMELKLQDGLKYSKILKYLE